MTVGRWVRRGGIVLLGVLILVATVAVGLYVVGAREPASQIASGSGPVWFVALRLAAAEDQSAPGAGAQGARKDIAVPWAELLRPGVALHWLSRAEFAVIGPAESYWHAFAVVQGTRDSSEPLDSRRFPGVVDDAQILALTLERPPRLVLGALKVLALSGLASVPRMTETAESLAQRALGGVGMPTGKQMAQVLNAPESLEPAMVNWLAYRSKADYPPGAKAPAAASGSLSGAAAYRRYGLVALQTAYRSGGQLIFVGDVNAVVRAPETGPTQGSWNSIAVMRYPRPSAMLGMEQVPAYRAALIDRAAGLERTVVIASDPERR
ncbi:MAG: hypothetical protein ACO3Z6_05400 [Pseudomonadales bacterium]